MLSFLCIFLLTCLQVINGQQNPISNSEFCKYCRCDAKTREVFCEIVFSEYIFNNTAYWRNEAANETYNFTTISIHKSDYTLLSTIPTSPVKVLDLSDNRLQNIADGTFRNLQDMVKLILSNNELTSDHLNPEIFVGLYQPGSYQPLKSLKVLKLDGNILHTLHQDLFSHISKLEILDLHGNPLKHIDVQTNIAIGSLPYLQNLDLSYTQLQDLPDHILHTLKNLKVLNLTANKLTKIPKTFEDAAELEWLNLDENPIQNITSESGFPTMMSLRILHMSNMPELHRIGDHSMCGMENLKELYMSDNHKLAYFSGKALSLPGEQADSLSWPDLEKLILRNNKLSYLEHNLLARWDSLKDIDIRDNPWACECENQWLIDELVPFIHKLNKNHTLNIECAIPIEMQGQTLLELSHRNYTMRCLDLFGNRPERDASILVGVLIGVFLAIIIILGVMLCYKRNWFGYLERGPAAFSRTFYNRTGVDDGELY